MIDIENRIELFNQGYWQVPDGLDTSNFDFTWRPEPHDRPYIHQFGTQHQKTGGPRFVIPEDEGIKYQSHQHAIRLPNPDDRCWRPLLLNCTVDFSWHPDETEPPYIYVFRNQWYDIPTYQYRVPGATDKKYITSLNAYLLPEKEKWETPDDIDASSFDYSWRPHPDEPAFIYQFGTQWQKTGGPRYIAEGATDIKYLDILKAKKLPNMRNWRMLSEIDTDKFDFSWHPDDTEPPMMYEFGTQWQKAGGPIYVTKGSTQKKYCSDQVAIRIAKEDRCYRPLVSNLQFDYSWHPDPNEPPYIYVFGNQWYDSVTMPTLLYRVNGATEKKYIDDIKVTLLPDKSKWDIPDDIEDDFDYSWEPHPIEPPFIWQFGTQWQKNGGPRYKANNATIVKQSDLFKATKKNNKENRAYRPLVENVEFDYSWHPDEDEPPYIYVFGNQWYDSVTMPTVVYRVKGATDTKYIDNVKATILPDKSKFKVLEYVDDFDYSWVPNPNDPLLNYVFGNEYFTPEFMPTIMYRMKGATETKYITDIKANLKVEDVYCEDSIFDEMKSHVFQSRYAYFNVDNNTINYDILRTEDEKLYVHLIDNVGAIIPREAKVDLYDKLVDYPYIKRHSLKKQNSLLDIVFFSNGEACAESNYEYLLSLNLPNRIVRVDKVKGRVASQHAAAKASNTSWYFLVNAKLKVNKDFDFTWQPDVFKSRRHYIFTATNPVNDLEYGHQAIVANNKNLTLNTVVRGLDYTMDSPTEVVNINSGISMYNSSPYDAWRTAFREMIKLCCNDDQDSIDRGAAWLNKGNGDFGEYSKLGARDAVDYYNSVHGNMEKLMLSYDWEWLYDLFVNI